MSMQNFRGQLRRKIQRHRNSMKALMEQIELEDGFKGVVRIDHWNKPENPNHWLVIRIKFSNPIVPEEHIQDLRQKIGEIFEGHL